MPVNDDKIVIEAEQMLLNDVPFALKKNGEWVIDELAEQALSKAQKNVLKRNLQNLATSAFRVGQALQGCVLGAGGILNLEGSTQLQNKPKK
tara:strand:- start:332 stop:607 length:276 start_codon:yes stop_codon:yes gene_type:complete